MPHPEISANRSDHVLSTERFCLKKMSDEDFGFLCEMYSDPLVMKYITTGVCDSKKTRELLKQFIKHWNDFGFGMWIVELKQTGEKLGYMGFRILPGKEGIEFGGLLIQKIWNQGAATEVGKMCLSYGFGHFGFKHVYSVVDPKNKPSHRWIQKLGMKRTPEKDGIFHDSFTEYYLMTSDQFKI